MGYNTVYSLEIGSLEGLTKLQQRDLYEEEIDGSFTIGQLTNGDCDEMRWYQHDDDMDLISKNYPNVLFTLRGEGEESGDIWQTWYRNGKHITVRAEVVIPEPDLTQLPLVDTVGPKIAMLRTQRNAMVEAMANLDAEIAQLVDSVEDVW